MRSLAHEADHLGPDVRLTTHLLPVDYQAVPAHLAAIVRDTRFDVVLHFGLAQRASAIALETCARNRIARHCPDRSGHIPATSCIIEGMGDHTVRLPVAPILARLKAANIPAISSDDAGDYLCNFVLYQSLAGLVPGLAPLICGFVHVPHTPQSAQAAGHLDPKAVPMSDETLLTAARTIIEESLRARRAITDPASTPRRPHQRR
jgi:pyroglutamyl-peptidase